MFGLFTAEKHCIGLDSGGDEHFYKHMKETDGFVSYNELTLLTARNQVKSKGDETIPSNDERNKSVMKPCTYLKVKHILGQITDEGYKDAMNAIKFGRDITTVSKLVMYEESDDELIQKEIRTIVKN
jgi:hypothetical protein